MPFFKIINYRNRLINIASSGNLGGYGYYPDHTGTGQRTKSYTIDLSTYENYPFITINNLLLILTSVSSSNGVNGNVSEDVGVDSYSITAYDNTTGLLSISVTYSASMGRVWYSFDVYALI